MAGSSPIGPVGPSGISPMGERPQNRVKLLQDTMRELTRAIHGTTFTNVSNASHLEHIANLIKATSSLTQKIAAGGG
jgi:hypothetical protein